MNILTRSITLIGLAAISTVALAQEEAEEAQATFTYATYFYCDVNGQDSVDEIVKTKNQPVYDQMVKEGIIKRWGWLAHHTGGKWRRVQYYQAGSVEALLDAQDEMNKRFDAMEDDGNVMFGSICKAHDDYIWEVEAGTSGKKRGEAGFSVYYKCDESKEERADEIWEKDFAPILNKFVADGKLTSWGWSSHLVGGEYRRLQTMTGANHKTLMKARAEVIEAMYAENSKPGEEFTNICGSHADYLWDIQIESL
jgi:hypothetical protein